MRYWKNKKIVGNPLVGIGVANYTFDENNRRAHALECLVASLRAQTYSNWKMLIYHDGPYVKTKGMIAFMSQWNSDPKIRIIETPERKQKFGHHHRQLAIDSLVPTCQWLLLTNDDNYYMPTFLEWLLSVGEKADFVYTNMIHSHKFWKPFRTEPKAKHLDLGAFIVRSTIAKKVPFDKINFSADGDWIARLVAKCKNRVLKVESTLMVHN